MCRTIYDVSKYFMKVAKRFALGSTFSSPFKVAARGDLSWKKNQVFLVKHFHTIAFLGLQLHTEHVKGSQWDQCGAESNISWLKTIAKLTLLGTCKFLQFFYKFFPVSTSFCQFLPVSTSFCQFLPDSKFLSKWYWWSWSSSRLLRHRRDRSKLRKSPFESVKNWFCSKIILLKIDVVKKFDFVDKIDFSQKIHSNLLKRRKKIGFIKKSFWSCSKESFGFIKKYFVMQLN